MCISQVKLAVNLIQEANGRTRESTIEAVLKITEARISGSWKITRGITWTQIVPEVEMTTWTNDVIRARMLRRDQLICTTEVLYSKVIDYQSESSLCFKKDVSVVR